MVINNYLGIGGAVNDNFSLFAPSHPEISRIAARVEQIERLVSSYMSGSMNYGVFLETGTCCVYEIAKETRDPEKIRTLFGDTKRRLSEPQIALLDEIVNTGIAEYQENKITTSK
ncbi:hypothetical protein ISS07_06410 [Candidatus Woesearchaeota archaeon]|nr:hypothetical protein [Candidatus Woesearchaeota archaeon]